MSRLLTLPLVSNNLYFFTVHFLTDWKAKRGDMVNGISNLEIDGCFAVHVPLFTSHRRSITSHLVPLSLLLRFLLLQNVDINYKVAVIIWVLSLLRLPHWFLFLQGSVLFTLYLAMYFHSSVLWAKISLTISISSYLLDKMNHTL